MFVPQFKMCTLFDYKVPEPSCRQVRRLNGVLVRGVIMLLNLIMILRLILMMLLVIVTMFFFVGSVWRTFIVPYIVKLFVNG